MNVFVLGAGASFHAGYPLASELGKRLAAWINTLPSDHEYHFHLGQILDVYGALDNFESILADLMTCQPGSPAEALGSNRPGILAKLQEAIRDHFDDIRLTPATLYEELARLLRPGDVVITFNYDLGIERALHTAGMWDVRTGYGFAIKAGEQPSAVEVLKLHGSTNWRALLFGGKTGSFVGSGNSLGHRPVLFFRSDLEYLDFPDFSDPLCSGIDCAASLPAMIMPALPKQFHFATTYGKEWKTFWDGLWYRAARAIAHADALIVIGYSLPTADERARAMLLGARNKAVRVSICCGKTSASLEQQFRDYEFTNIEVVAPTFECFLADINARGNTGAVQITAGATTNRRMDTLTRLNSLVGKQGLLKIRFAGEVGFIFLEVYPPSDLPTEADDAVFQAAITRSEFLVRFDEGNLIDGSETKVIPGLYISLIRGKY